MSLTSYDRMTQDEYDNFIDLAITKNNAFKTIVSKHDLSGCGSTCDHYGNVEKIIIGTKQHNPDAPLTYADLTSTLIAFYHEMGHARQVQHVFKEKTDLSTVLALNHYARKCSSAYYGADEYMVNASGNYAKHPDEIAAQYYGLALAYDYLSENIDPESANMLICDYINNEVGADYIPVDKNNPYTNATDILDKFNEVFNEKIYEHRSFEPKNNRPDDVYYQHGNHYKTLMLQSPRTSGLQQDAILTKLYMEHSCEKGYFRKTGMKSYLIHALDNIDFSKIVVPVTGKRHVPAVQKVNLDELLPQPRADNPSNDDEYS